MHALISFLDSLPGFCSVKRRPSLPISMIHSMLLSINGLHAAWFKSLAMASSLLLAVLMGFTAHAAPGQIDRGFAVIDPGITYGRLYQLVGDGASTSVSAVLTQTNGGILVGGTCNSAFNSQGFSDGIVKARFCVTRYRPPSGSPTNTWIDTSFGNQGSTGVSIHTAYSNRPEYLSDMALLPNGKILTAGTCSYLSVTYFCVTRLHPNGTLDTTFGDQGSASNNIGAGNQLKKILVQPDGRILALGNCTQASVAHFCVWRLMADGSTDNSFGNAGFALLTTPFTRTLAGAVLRADGAIIIAGVCDDFGRNLCVRALTANGQVDPDFGPAVSATNPFSTLHISMGTSIGGEVSIARTASGKFVLSIDCVNTPTQANTSLFCLTRVNNTGTLDNGFGTNGINGRAYHRIGALGSSTAFPFALAIQPDGKIVAGGLCIDPTVDFCVARFHSEGALDTSYDGIGFHTTLTARPVALGSALALQPDGKAVIAGSCTEGGLTKYCTARLEGGPYGYRNCSMDIDGDGRVLGTTDAIIHARVSAGLSGAAVMNGLSFAPNATRTTWPDIRDYLGNHCGVQVGP
jgi:uncharacterized delta-60 repeat protein